MSGKAQTAAKTPADAALQDVAKASHAKPDPTGAAKASEELSEDDLEVVVGGVQSVFTSRPTNYSVNPTYISKIGPSYYAIPKE